MAYIFNRLKKGYAEYGDSLYKEWCELPKIAKTLSISLSLLYISFASFNAYSALACTIAVSLSMVAIMLSAIRHKDKFMIRVIAIFSDKLGIQKGRLRIQKVNESEVIK